MDFFTLVGVAVCVYFLIYAICLWFTDCNLQLAYAEKFGKKLVKLRGKVVWITEASTELGKMMALKIAEHHGKLVLSSTSVEELKSLKASCLKINPALTNQDILILEFDIAELDSHKSNFEKVIKHFGTLDILIANEDKWEKSAWESTLPAADRLIFQANVFGVLSLSRVAVKYFNFKQKGKLVIASSIAGLIGVPYSGCYTATKHALHGYYNSLRIEKLGENLQITLLCLGSSELSQERFTNNDRFLESGNAAKKSGSKKKMAPERCAHLCLTAIVNNLDEAWMAVFPILPLVYGMKYYPTITKYLLNYLKSTGE